jgi:superfamily II DNA/RNA helicase
MNRLTEEKMCQGIIITPTRELTSQVYDVAMNLAKYTKHNVVKCIGGTNIGQSKNELRTATLVIGTLGRLYHMILEKKLLLHKLKFIVLDEADKILSDGLDNKLQMIFEKAPLGCTNSINISNNV